MVDQFAEVARHLERANASAARLRSASSGAELREAWESYLYDFSRTIGRLIALGMKTEGARPWANRLKNASTRDDPGLIFLREARNFAEHGLTPCAVFNDSHLDVGGAVKLGRNVSATFSNVWVNGVSVDEFSVSTDSHGNLKNSKGHPSELVNEVPASIELTSICSEEKRKTFPVPKSLDGNALEYCDPNSLAEVSLDFLVRKFAELKEF